MKNAKIKKFNKFIATMLIISMIFTSGGMASFASVELGDAESLETSSFIDEETNVGEAINFSEEESNVGEATSFSEEDAEEPEEDIVEEDEGIAVEEESEEEESTGEYESTVEEEESNVEEATSFPEEDVEEPEEDIVEEEEGREDHAPTAATSSEIEERYNDEIATESEIDLEVEEKIVDESIFGAPTERTAVFQLPSDLVKEGAAEFTSLPSGSTLSEDGTTLTISFGTAMGSQTRLINFPSVRIQAENNGLDFRNKWSGGGSSGVQGSTNVTFTDSNPTVTFTPDYTDDRKTLTFKIEANDLKYASFSEIQDPNQERYPKRVEYKNEGEISTKYYRSFNPICNAYDEKYEVTFNNNSILNNQDTTHTARVSIGHYKVIYTIPQEQQDQTKMQIHIEGQSAASGQAKYEQVIYNENGTFTLARLISNDSDYKRKLDSWVDDVTGEEYQPGEYTHTGIKHLRVTARIKDYVPAKITYNIPYGYTEADTNVEKGTTIATPSVVNYSHATFKYWYLDDENAPIDFNTYVFNEDTTLNAKFDLDKFNITYNKNGGSFVDGYTAPISHNYYDALTLPTSAEIKKDYATFVGWYKEEDFSNSPITSIPQYDENEYVLYAKWNEKTYLNSFNISGGRYLEGKEPKYERAYSEEIIFPTANDVESTGNRFVGWRMAKSDGTVISENATSIPAYTEGDFVMTAIWEENEYDLILNLNGGSYADGFNAPSNKRLYSSAVTLPTSDQVVKTGYTFAGWYDNENFTGDAVTNIIAYTPNGITLYAKWNEKSYTITYNLNGGNVVNVSDMVLNRSFTTSVTLLTGSQVEKVGSGFDGWYESSDFSGSAITIIPANTDRNVVLYAKWVDRDYIITYHTDGGTFVNGYNVITSRKYGDYVYLPTEDDITKEGYTFKGWYTNSNFSGNKITFIDSEAIRDYDLYLWWSEKSFSITVSNDGTLKEGVSIKSSRLYSEEVILPTSDQISRVGYTFKGWELKRTDNNQVLSENAIKIESNTAYNVKVTSKWTQNSYSVTYYDYGATYTTGFIKPTKRNYTDGIVLPGESGVTKIGYSFGGWYTNSEFTGNPITSIPAFNTNDAVVYLKWIEKDYSITYNENGGTFKDGYTKPTSRKYTAAITLPTGNDISKPGYTFAGWYDNAELTGAAVYTVAANTDEDKNYYAKWAPRQYNVIYHEDGGVYRSGFTKVTKRNYDEAVTLPTSIDITKDGGTFIGWYDNDKFTGNVITTIPAYTDKDVHVYVKWNEAMFTITYNENGGVYKDGYNKITERRYSDPVYLPQNGDIIKKGYTFGGWYENNNFTGAVLKSIPAKTNRNVVLYAKWVDGVYTITYNENGGTYVNGYQKITVRNYTDEIKLPTKENIIKEGFDLEGWYESPEFRGSALTKIPANTDTNKVLYAKWKGKQFNVTLNTNGGKIHYGNVKKYSHSIGAILPTAVIPPDEHKKFAGWYENENLTGAKVERIDPSSLGDKTYYAKYDPVYLLKFNAGGGIGTMSNIQVDYGKNVNIPNNSFVKEGYKFKNWISDKGKTYEANKSITLNADTILIAEWEIIDNSNPSSGGSSDPGSGDSGSGGSSDSGNGNSGGGNSGSGSSGSGNSGSGNSGSGNAGSGNSGSGSSSGKSSGKTGGNTGGSTGGGTSGGSGGSGGGSGGGGGGNSGSASSGGPGSVSAGGETTPNANNGSSASNESGDTVPNIPTGPNSTFNVTTENSATESKPKSNISSDILKQIEDGTAKPGMYYAWEGQAPKWKARDIVTNEYVKNTFIYAEYAGKVRKYFFNELGEMAVGWINYNGYIYYMNPTEGINYGDMVTGVQYVDGKLCEFLPSGEFYRVIYQM